MVQVLPSPSKITGICDSSTGGTVGGGGGVEFRGAEMIGSTPLPLLFRVEIMFVWGVVGAPANRLSLGKIPNGSGSLDICWEDDSAGVVTCMAVTCWNVVGRSILVAMLPSVRELRAFNLC